MYSKVAEIGNIYRRDKAVVYIRVQEIPNVTLMFPYNLFYQLKIEMKIDSVGHTLHSKNSLMT
jgi:hypothetical protein